MITERPVVAPLLLGGLRALVALRLFRRAVHPFLVDKLPVIGVTDDEISKLPLEKYIRVEIINDLGNLVEITTEKPDGIETEDKETHFIVFKDIIKIE